MKLKNPHQITRNQVVGDQFKMVITFRLSRLYCSDQKHCTVQIIKISVRIKKVALLGLTRSLLSELQCCTVGINNVYTVGIKKVALLGLTRLLVSELQCCTVGINKVARVRVTMLHCSD